MASRGKCGIGEYWLYKTSNRLQGEKIILYRIIDKQSQGHRIVEEVKFLKGLRFSHLTRHPFTVRCNELNSNNGWTHVKDPTALEVLYGTGRTEES